jgi:hypothetical protein
MHLLLALKCFFLVLFGRRLPPEAVDLLPEGLAPRALPESADAERPAEKIVERVVERIVEVEKDPAAATARGAVLMLSVLQREGRLVDFLQESIDGFSDGQIGAAVRDIHRGCRKALAEHVQLEPVMTEPDGATVKIAAGFDASRVRLVGNVAGKPPFTGALRHPGWRGAKVTLPRLDGEHDATVIAPAEVEL